MSSGEASEILTEVKSLTRSKVESTIAVISFPRPQPK